jgi:ubiquinone/menaquinone biosynthesis C-methylase UbiE
MKSNDEWKIWGKTDPLFGVATWEGREKSGLNPWTDDEFYSLGDDWFDFQIEWTNSVGFRRDVVLEIGCGAGRITQHLADSFDRVLATDVSSDILEYARRRVMPKNITWVESDGSTLPLANSCVDAVFSCQVFQHFPSTEVQLNLFKEIHRVLKPGGSFFIHLPIHVYPLAYPAFSKAMQKIFHIFLYLYKARAWIRRQLMGIGFGSYMQMTSYELDALLLDLNRLGFSDVCISMVRPRKSLGIHWCVSGRV